MMRPLSRALGRSLLHPALLAIATLVAWPGVVVAQSADDCRVPPGSETTPPNAAGVSTEVRVGVYLVDVSRIANADQAATVDFTVRLTWNDSRLAPTEERTCRFPLGAVWNPRVMIVNDRSLQGRLDQVVEVDATGRVRYVQRFRGAVATPLDLREFPFDQQELGIELVATRADPIEIVVDQSLQGRTEQFTISDWSVGASTAQRGTRAIGPNSRLAALRFSVTAERDPTFFLWRIVLPLCLIVCMSWSVFWIDPTVLPAQMGVSTSSVLTLIAFYLAVGNMLPRIPYLTRLDRFLVGATLLVFLAFAEAVITTTLNRHGRTELSARIDRWSRVAFPMVFATIVVLWVWP